VAAGPAYIAGVDGAVVAVVDERGPEWGRSGRYKWARK
jgi:hypothetical protein